MNGKKLGRLIAGAAIFALPATVVTAVSAVRAQDAVPTVGVPGGPLCTSSFNPYVYSPSELQACGIPTFPRQRTADLPGGGKEYVYSVDGTDITYRIPPAGFLPLTASDQQLQEYGLPPRPAAGPALSHWQATVGHTQLVTPPPFLVEGTQPLRQTLESPASTLPNAGSITSDNWSGYYLVCGSSHCTYSSMEGDYFETAPTSSQPCTNNQVTPWVGIGGVNSNALAQEGTWINYPGWRQHSMWTEILPAPPINQGVTANPNDQMQAILTHENSPQGWQFFVNDITTSQSVNPFYGTSSWDGSTADFIVERPTGSYIYPLTRFNNPLTFDYAVANNLSMTSWYTTSINMYSKTTGHELANPGSIYGNGYEYNDYYDNCG